MPVVLQLGLVAFLRAEFGDKEGVSKSLHDAARHGSVAKLAEVKGCRAGFYVYGPEYKQWHRDYPDENPGTWTPENAIPCDETPPDPNAAYTPRGLMAVLLVMMLIEVRADHLRASGRA